LGLRPVVFLAFMDGFVSFGVLKSLFWFRFSHVAL
jgi:hypothetical protein